MSQAKCLVLGGGGFLGSHIAEGLLAQGYDVRIFDRFPRGKANIHHLMQDVEITEGEFGRVEDVERALQGIDCVFHYLGSSLPQGSNADPYFDIKTNLVDTLTMLQTVIRMGVSKVVFASSGGTVYGIPKRLPIDEDAATDPMCSYGITKLAVEKYLQVFHHLYGLDYLVLRYANPYGERQNPEGQQGAIAVFLSRVAMGETVEIWGDGSVVRDFVYVGDAVDATIRAFEHSGRYRLFNVGSGKGTSLGELLATIGSAIGSGCEVVYREGRPTDVPASVLDISRIGRETGWAPKTSLEDGIGRTWEWVRTELSSRSLKKFT
ncbi:MAG: NAD-dependent epimerase/dehydratase family protein [Chloroflexi bacterium]|nr:NAD-dependent epimerase/dehydratase family protein [Chloroflexota bacterium]